MGQQSRAADVRAPYDAHTPNDFQVRKFTSGTTHAANAVPKAWEGKYVTIYATGDVHFAFSSHDDAEVDRNVAASADGASAKVGGLITTIPRSMRVPPSGVGNRTYFVRESASSQVVYMELSSS